MFDVMGGSRRGLRGLGVPSLSPAEAQAAGRAALGPVYANLEAKGEAILNRYGPGIEAVAKGVQAVDSGAVADVTWATVDVALAAAALVPPVGTIIAAVGKVLFGMARWLVETYPAAQVECMPFAIRRICYQYRDRYLPGVAEPFRNILRDERRFWIGSVHTRPTSRSGWAWANNSENICKPYLPGVIGARAFEGGPIVDKRFCMYMDAGSEPERLSYLDIACRPRRLYKAGLASPLGTRNWAEWEADPAFPERQRRRDADMTAAVLAGAEIRDRLIANGDPRYIGTWGELCAFYGFMIKLSGLPNESLIEILSRIAQSAPESLPDNVDPNTYIRLAPDQPGAVYWSDGLVEAYMRFWGFVDQQDKTYAAKALIDEYNDRTRSGAMKMGSRRSTPPPPVRWSTTKKVVVAGAAVGVPIGTYFLGRALGWWK
jgi:hypothetical protein